MFRIAPHPSSSPLLMYIHLFDSQDLLFCVHCIFAKTMKLLPKALQGPEEIPTAFTHNKSHGTKTL
jgi:hypothetical protein